MASFGENLRRERELRGISLREIADATRISVRFLEALEQERTDVLPGGLFPRAFLRQYAEHLGLDADRVVAEYLMAHGEPSPERRPRPARRRLPVSPGGVFFAAVAVAAVVLAFRRPAEEGAERATTARPTPPPAVVLPTDRVYPPPAPTASAPSESLVLSMTAQQSCWVLARADGETVINRVLEEGESETLEANGEIVLSVGNAGGLAIRVNDRPAAPLGRSGEVRRNIVITRQSLPSLVKPEAPLTPGQSG
jgi:cytoskeletal protein RodZ